jgi:glycosidase
MQLLFLLLGLVLLLPVLHGNEPFAAPSLTCAAPYLGWIPMQAVQAGETAELDMHRFCSLADGQRLEVGPHDSQKVQCRMAALQLTATVAPDARGVVRVPLRVVDAQGVALRHGDLEFAISPRHGHLFRLPADTSSPAKVTLAGSFNGWNTDSHPMARAADGSFELFVPLPPGRVEYKYVVDGKWMPDPANSQRSGDGNSVMEVDGEVGSPPLVFASRREGEAVVFQVVERGAPIVQLSALIQMPDGTTRPVEVGKARAGEISVSCGSLAPGSWVRLTAADAEGRVSPVARALASEDDAFRWQDGIMYYAFTDRFANGNEANDDPVEHTKLLDPANYHGGDFEGIRQRIESGYFKDLGINILWLAPLNQNPEGAWQEHLAPYRFYSGYHGYWPVSSTAVERRFGGEAALESLVGAAHEAGIKIIADLVLKHVHVEHPLWSEKRDWFGTLDLPDGTKNLRRWDDHQFTTWFEEWLPGFDFEKDEPVAFLIGNGADWARRFSLDGYRLDAVKHIPHSFWRKFRSAMRAAVPDTRTPPMYFVGETFMDRRGIMSFVGPNMLDGQFDFPLYDTLVPVFSSGEPGFVALERSLHDSETIYGKETLMSPLVGNHDKPRFLAYADGDMQGLDLKGEIELGWSKPPSVDDPRSFDELKLALSFLMAIDGVPMIYYGDEVGLTGAGDPDNRRMMPREDALTNVQRAVRTHFQKVAAIRHAHPALRYGSRRALLADSSRYAFVRRHFSDAVAVLWNRSDEPASFSLDLAPEFPDASVTELLTGRTAAVKAGRLTIELPPRSSAFLTPTPSP